MAAMTFCVPEASLKLAERQGLARELLAACTELSRRIGADDPYSVSATALNTL